MDTRYFGDNLKLIREKWSLGQKELGILLNVTRSSIASYESKDKYPKFETLFRLEELSDIRGKDLIFSKINLSDIPTRPIMNQKDFLAEPDSPKYQRQKKDFQTQLEEMKQAYIELTKRVTELEEEMKKKSEK